MREYQYIIVEQRIGEGDTMRISYGIAAAIVYDECIQVLHCFYDLSTERAPVQELVQTCNALELDVLHLSDVVDDFMATAYGE